MSSRSKSPSSHPKMESIWQEIEQEARNAAAKQSEMASYYYVNVLNHNNFSESIRYSLSNRLANRQMSAMTLHSLMSQAMEAEPDIVHSMLADLLAHYERDAACDQYILPLLFFKGYHAMQAHRIAHYYWGQNRKTLAYFLQHRINELFDVDIHPAAQFGQGVMLDHATGIVVGETAIVENNVSLLHGVTLGGSGAAGGQRHPTIRSGVLLSNGAKLLGNIEIGENAKVGAGSELFGVKQRLNRAILLRLMSASKRQRLFYQMNTPSGILVIWGRICSSKAKSKFGRLRISILRILALPIKRHLPRKQSKSKTRSIPII